MRFARNPVQAADAAHSLLADTGMRDPLWLLVDPAVLPEGSIDRTSNRLGRRAKNAFAGSELEAYGAHAPQLVSLAGEGATAFEALERCLRLDAAAPACSVLVSSVGEPQLIQLLSHLALARIDDDLLAHCRFADTRILPSFLSILNREQSTLIGAYVDTWAWLDHLGQPQYWRRNAHDQSFGPSPPSAEHVQINAQQFAKLLRDSEPDSLFLLLSENVPELVPGERRGAFRDQLSRILSIADRYCLATPGDRLQFAVLSLSCSDQFHLHPGLLPTWSALAAGGSTLEAEMKSWRDELWTELQAMPKEDAR